MNTIDKLLEISSRIEHLEHTAEWIARETVHTDNVLSQTGSMLCALADDLRERVFGLVKDMESILEIDKLH